MRPAALPRGHTPIIFFTISYMACSSSSSLRHRYFRKIRSPHRKAKPVQDKAQRHAHTTPPADAHGVSLRLVAGGACGRAAGVF